MLCSRAEVPKESSGEAIGESEKHREIKRKVSPKPSILERPVPWDECQEQQQQRNEASRSLEDKCVLQRAESEE